MAQQQNSSQLSHRKEVIAHDRVRSPRRHLRDSRARRLPLHGAPRMARHRRPHLRIPARRDNRRAGNPRSFVRPRHLAEQAIETEVVPMTNPHPHPRSDLDQITARNQTARHMITGFAAEKSALAEFGRHLDTALTDNLTLSAEVTRLNAELSAARLDRANLLAAMRATLAAHGDDEPDPMCYLRA